MIRLVASRMTRPSDSRMTRFSKNEKFKKINFWWSSLLIDERKAISYVKMSKFSEKIGFEKSWVTQHRQNLTWNRKKTKNFENLHSKSVFSHFKNLQAKNFFLKNQESNQPIWKEFLTKKFLIFFVKNK